MSIVNGIFTAILTAFDSDGHINEAGQRALVRHVIDHNHTDGIFVGGTIGERYKLTTAMLKELFAICMDEANGAVKMLANISALSEEETFELGQEARRLGYDAVGMIPPFFHAYSQAEIVAYYKYIADHIELPLMIYVIPSFSGVQFSEAMLVELLRYPGIKGIKYTHNDYYTLDRVRVNCPDSTLFTGFDDVLFHALAMGTDGAIGGTFNITGLFAKKLYEAIKAGDLKKALVYQRNINDIEDMLNETGLFTTLKCTVQAMGIECGDQRRPSLPSTPAQHEQARKIVAYIREHQG